MVARKFLFFFVLGVVLLAQNSICAAEDPQEQVGSAGNWTTFDQACPQGFNTGVFAEQNCFYNPPTLIFSAGTVRADTNRFGRNAPRIACRFTARCESTGQAFPKSIKSCPANTRPVQAEICRTRTKAIAEFDYSVEAEDADDCNKVLGWYLTTPNRAGIKGPDGKDLTVEEALRGSCNTDTNHPLHNFLAVGTLETYECCALKGDSATGLTN